MDESFCDLIYLSTFMLFVLYFPFVFFFCSKVHPGPLGTVSLTFRLKRSIYEPPELSTPSHGIGSGLITRVGFFLLFQTQHKDSVAV